MEKLSPTLQKLYDYVEEIMSRGGPKNKNELEAMKIFNRLYGGKAFNAGKRNKRSENDKLIKKK